MLHYTGNKASKNHAMAAFGRDYNSLKNYMVPGRISSHR
jgi:hypothetical protein